jgi:cytochrome c biogenesis protein CcmG, thiol:disulfide interchange protein DsbE
MRYRSILVFIPLIICLIIGIFLWRGLQLDPRELPSVLLDKPVPTFVLPDLLNPQQQIDQSDFSGQYSLLNVWASWCYACRVEHPWLMQLASDRQIPIYGLNYKDEPEDALAWLQQWGNPYTRIAADQAGKLAIDLGVYGAPETFLINADGIIRYRHVGVLTRDVWQTEFLPRMDS